MKDTTTSVLGFDPPVSNVPTTLSEAVESAGGEQLLVDGWTRNRIYHNTNTEVRVAICEALEKATGIKRLMKQEKSPTKADPNRMVEKFDESEQQYSDRVRAETKLDTAGLWDLIKDEVGVTEFKGQGEARVGGPRTTKTDLTTAQTLLAEADKWPVAVQVLQQKNPGLVIELDDKGVPTLPSLANALGVNRRRKLAEANAELGLQAAA